MKKNILISFLILLTILNGKAFSNTSNDLYEKIDLFGEVMEKIKKEYVDDVDQAEWTQL